MKNIKSILFIIGIFCITNVNAQIRAIGGSPASVTTSSAFLDASSNATYDGSANSAKGIVFPRVDLSLFTSFLGVTGSSSSFRTRYDGMIVYNTKNGGVAGVGSTQGTLTPGFWFYDNSSAGVGVGTIAGGTWKPLGSSAATANNVLAVSTATYTALATDGTLLVDVPSGGATVTLPVAATNNGKILIVKKVDDDTDVLTFNSAVKVTVTESFTTLNYATTLKIQSDGTNWWLIN